MGKTEIVLAFLVAAVLAGLFVSREGFEQKSIGMPLNGPGMGPYDNVSVDGWSANEPGALINGPLPSDSSTNDLMFLVGNSVDPSCCPAAFTTDTGCVCLSGKDKAFMASRAGNRA